jgi:tetratricopeptide (TPR) repeat protein
VAVALGAATVVRNHDYRSRLALWAATAEDMPGNPRAHHNLGLELAQAGDRPAAIRAQQEAVRLGPGYVDAHLELAALLLADGRAAEAAPHIAAARELRPDTSNGYNNLGHVQLLSGDVAGATASFETAVRLGPANHEAHNNLGYCLAAQGRLEEALVHLHRSVALQPAAPALLNLGDALLKAGQAEEGMSVLAEALQRQPDLAEAHLSLANALAGHRRYAEALPHYLAVVQAESGSVPAWFNLGIVQRRLGQPDAAREAFHRVLAIDPDNAPAQRQLEQLEGGTP